MTRARKSVTDGASLVGAQAATSVAGVLFLVVATRWLTDVEIAALAAWEVLLAIVRVVTSLGLVGTLAQRVPAALAARDLPLVRGYMRLGLVSQSVLVLPAALGVALLAGPASRLFFDTPHEVTLVYLLAAACVSGRIYDQVTVLLAPLDRFRALTGCRLAHDVVLRLSALGGYAAAGMAGLFGTIVLGELVISAAAVFAVRHQILGPALRVPLREVITYSAPFYWIGYLRFGTMQADQLAVSALLGPRALATYFVARRLYVLLEALANHLVTPLIPKLAALRVEGTQRLGVAFARSARLLLTVLIPPAIYVALLAPLLVRFVGDGEYPEAAPLLVIFCAVGILYGANQLCATLVFVAGRPSQSFRLYLVAGLSSVASLIALGAAFGIWGIALSRVVSQGVTVVVGRDLVRTIIRARVDAAALARVTVATALSTPPVVICLVSGWHGPISMPAALAISFGACAVMVARALRHEDRALAVDALPAPLCNAARRLLRVADPTGVPQAATSTKRSSSDGHGRLTSRT